MSPIIPKRTLEDIRFRNDIVDVIGASLNLKRAGSAHKALCPFHKEKTPSFHVNQQRQIYHCFGCGAGGDVFRFLMQYEGVDFMTAVKMLAQRAGIPLELEDGGPDAGDKVALLKLHTDMAAFYHRILLTHSSAERARAISVSCFCAIASFLTLVAGSISIPSMVRRLLASERILLLSTRGNGLLEGSLPKKMFSATVRSGTSVSSW